jgi:hypothetical protein
MRSLSPGDRRTLWMGIGVILLLVLLGRGIPAWRRWDADARGSAAEMAAEAARAESETRRLPVSLDSLQARRARYAALGGGILPGESTAAAGASLAALVSGAAARAGVQIGSVQVRPDTAGAGTFMRISVQADGTGDLPAVTRMLVMLEGGRELLAVRQLSITQPNPGGPAELPESLRLDITVEGMALAAPGTLPLGTLARDTLARDTTGADDASGAEGAGTLSRASGDSLLEALP